jgi:hypothetical protein
VPAASHPLTELALDLAWSHWTALGVRGVFAPPETAVDPEALLPLTARLEESDPRLADEAIDWCVRYGASFVSKTRLKGLLARFDAETQRRFEVFAATVNAHARTGWPTNAVARRWKPSGKSLVTKLDHPSQALLRLRAAFGTTSRAEILLAMVTQRDPREWRPTSWFAALGYTRRSVARILDELALSGVAEVKRIENANAYRLRDVATLRRLVPPLPDADGAWHLRLPLLASALDLVARVEKKSTLLRAIEAHRWLDEHARTLSMLDATPPATLPPETFWDRFLAWLPDVVATSEPATRSSARSG